jgi:hypothetical protein
MSKPSPELRNLFVTYLHRSLRPESALEYASSFVLDLINAFGDKLSDEQPLQAGWQEFSPFSFILQLNELLQRYKLKGFNSLDDVEKTILADTQVMLGALITSALSNHKTSDISDERFQIPTAVAADLDFLITH